jgi:hypothetical protein
VLDWFYSILGECLSVRSLEYRLAHAKHYFYTLCTFGIDGSEQGIKGQSTNTFYNLKFYSTKKGKHTINVLVIVALNGKVLWVSKAFPGSWNDNQINELMCDIWIKLFTPEEHGVGDSGFAGFGPKIIVPPSRNSPLYSEFSAIRIVVENALADIKDWRCCKDDIRDPVNNVEKVLERHHKKWVVVSVFKNDYNGRGGRK